MIDDVVDRMHRELAGLTGPARARPLHDLARVLADRYWRTGPGRPEGRADLDAAIEALAETYGYFEPGDSLRAPVAAQLGWLLATRYLAHGGSVDRDTAIARLGEGLDHPGLPGGLAPAARVMLGQVYLSRGFGGAGGVGAMLSVRPGTGRPAQTADARAAAGCFRQALAEPAGQPQLTAIAEVLLRLAEGLGASTGRVDSAAVTRAAQDMQRLQQQGVVGIPAASPFGGQRLADLDPLDRPVVVTDGPDPNRAAARRPATAGRPAAAGRPAPGGRPATATYAAGAARAAGARSQASPPPGGPDADALRLAFAACLAANTDAGPGAAGDPIAAVGALLARDASRPDAGTADELVALATAIVHSCAPTPTDHLLLALALYLRSRADEGSAAADDADAARQSLHTAANGPAVPPEAFPAMLRLGVVLADRDTDGRIPRARAEVAAALRAVGADALAYPQSDGVLLLHAATGRVALTTERTLPRRVLVVGERRPATGTAIVSTVASHVQAVALAGRCRRAVDAEAVLLADPRGDRPQAGVDALLLRRACYPHAAVLGRAAAPGGNAGTAAMPGRTAAPGGNAGTAAMPGRAAVPVDGAGTAADLLARLGASMLHLGCAVSATGALLLAGGSELTPAKIAAAGRTGRPGGGLVVLPPAGAGFAALADAFLTAGCTGVVGWLCPVPDRMATAVHLALHVRLVTERLDPAAAVHAVRRWLRTPERPAPPHLPAAYVAELATIDLREFADALVHRGI